MSDDNTKPVIPVISVGFMNDPIGRVTSGLDSPDSGDASVLMPVVVEECDLVDTILSAHGQLQALLARRGGRLPINVYMAMCYLQIEITGRGKPRTVESLWPGGSHAKAV